MRNDNSQYIADVFLYCGVIDRRGYGFFSDALESVKNRRPRALLALGTGGGDPDAAYRISRALSHHYNEVDILIPGFCKSAGTLLCIGSNRLIIGDRGELGPLDVQLSKPDEILASVSGLNILQAISFVQTETLEAFTNYLLEIRRRSGITTKMAADIAVNLALGFSGPIASKIDPSTLGEHQRALEIATEYGKRLNERFNSLKPGALIKLTSGFASHSFVIDRKEARELFQNVISVPEAILPIYRCVKPYTDALETFIAYVEPHFYEQIGDLNENPNTSINPASETKDTNGADEGSDGSAALQDAGDGQDYVKSARKNARAKQADSRE